MHFTVMTIATVAVALLSLNHTPGGSVLASTIEVPTFDKSTFSITGTEIIDYTNETTLEVPYKNTTATIDIREYKQCVLDSNQVITRSVNDAESNLKYLQALGMEGCIIFNSK